MTAHIKHIAKVLPQVGDDVEDALMLGDERANFVVLAWVDGTIQSISNMPREDLVAALRHHLGVLEADTLRPGLAGQGH